MFKKRYLYIKLFVNKIEICYLNTGKCLSRAGSFSDSRILYADFEKAEILMRQLLKELFPKKRMPTFYVIVQQLERNEGGISPVEKRAIQDSCRFGVNAKSVELLDSPIELSSSEAMKRLSKK